MTDRIPDALVEAVCSGQRVEGYGWPTALEYRLACEVKRLRRKLDELTAAAEARVG